MAAVTRPCPREVRPYGQKARRPMSDAMRAETVTITGAGGDEIEAYLAQPLDGPPAGGVVVIHHMPGYDEQTKEITRNFAAHGYLAICPNLYWREAPGASPDDAAATARAQGGRARRAVGGRRRRGRRPSEGPACPTARWPPSATARVAVSRSWPPAASPLDAAVDCYGAFIVAPPPEGLPLKMSPSSTWPRTSPARCSDCSGARTSTRPRPRWPSWRRPGRRR